MDTVFSHWLMVKMNELGWSQSDLARHSGLTRQTISYYLGDKSKKPDKESLSSIARALRLPPEEVFRAAGILPPVTPRTALIQKIEHIVSELPPEEQQNILDFALHRHEIAEKRGERHAKKTSENPALSGSA
jgi:transcriptional regulator with XRE-family HTH domain